MTPNGPRVREAILHVVNSADQQGRRLTQFDLLKSLFLADQAHLNHYGRPITYDQYVAMRDGPVPSLAYNVLKNERSALAEIGVEVPLWAVEKADGLKFHYYGGARRASDDVLSESDMEALETAVATVLRLGYGKTWDLVHNDRAWKDAYAKKGLDKQHPMELALIFDEPDFEQAELIKFHAANA